MAISSKWFPSGQTDVNDHFDNNDAAYLWLPGDVASGDIIDDIGSYDLADSGTTADYEEVFDGEGADDPLCVEMADGSTTVFSDTLPTWEDDDWAVLISFKQHTDIPSTIRMIASRFNSGWSGWKLEVNKHWDGDVFKFVFYLAGDGATDTITLETSTTVVDDRDLHYVLIWHLSPDDSGIYSDLGTTTSTTDIGGLDDVVDFIIGNNAATSRLASGLGYGPIVVFKGLNASNVVTDRTTLCPDWHTYEPASGSVGSAAGTSTAAAVGDGTAAAAGSAAGTSTAAAVGDGTTAAAGSAAGSSTASAVGAGTTASDGSTAGTSTATAVGATTVASAGSAAGSSTAAAVGNGASASDGAVAGSSTATAVGAATVAADGYAAGTSTAAAVSSTPGSVGSSAGTSTATAVGAATAASAGSAVGTSTASAVGAGTAASAGSAVGTSTASAVGAGASASAGSATGSSTAVGASTVAAAGSAAGSSTAAAVGAATVAAAGVAAGSSTATAAGASAASAVGSAAGTSTAAAVAGHTGSAAGTSTATAVGVSIAAAAGSAAGSSTAAAVSTSEAITGALVATVRPTTSMIGGNLRATSAVVGTIAAHADLLGTVGIGAITSAGVDDDMVTNLTFTVTTAGDEFTVTLPTAFSSSNYTIVPGVGTVPGDYGIPKMPHGDRTSTHFKVYFNGVVAVGTKIDFHCKEIA